VHLTRQMGAQAMLLAARVGEEKEGEKTCKPGSVFSACAKEAVIYLALPRCRDKALSNLPED